MTNNVENSVENYLYCPNDNMIPLENNKNIIGLEEYLNDNTTEKQQILTINRDSKLLSEMTDIKIEDEIISCKLKEETDDHLDDKVLFEEDTYYVNDIQLNDCIKDEKIEFCESTVEENFKIEIHDNRTSEVKMEDDTFVNNVSIKFENTFLSCDHCNEDYEDYCIKCQMLIYILNGNTLHNIDNKAENGIPNNFVKIKESFEHRGVYTLKHIPEGVKFGPFTGLKISESSLKIKRGRFIVDNDKLEFLNWMQFINPAQNILEHNLAVFQNGDDVYYRSTHEIQEGEELLVYFGEKYEISLINDIEMEFIPIIETDIKDVFACTFCCLGFSTIVYLNKHKTVCRNDISEQSSNKDIMQCPHCKIYLEQWEYLEYHLPRCRDENNTQCVLSTSVVQIVASSTQNRQHERYEKAKVIGCFLCEYDINSKPELKEHFEGNHIKDGKYKCTKCCFDTKYKCHLKEHFEAHESVKRYKCSKCDYGTNHKSHFKQHFDTHEVTKRFKCSKCDYETNNKSHLKQHFDTHEGTKRFKCSKCDYETNNKSNLQRHFGTHEITKQFKCSRCDYGTNNKSNLQKHFNNHNMTKEFKCSKCVFATNYKSNLQQHFDTHGVEKQFKCSKCDYATNHQRYLRRHVLDHEAIKQFKCSKCDYATNHKHLLRSHVLDHETIKRFKCSKCHYTTNYKCNLQKHFNNHEVTKRFKSVRNK